MVGVTTLAAPSWTPPPGTFLGVPPRALPVALRATAYRAAYALSGAVLLGLLRVHRPPTFCLLRATTGVPCPFCGTTTAAVRIGRGNLLGALAANPFTLLGAGLVVLAPVLAGRLHVPHRLTPWLLTCGVMSAWAWQLARFYTLPY
jgi:hypothetical protein